MKEKEVRSDSIVLAGSVILVCGVLFIALGVLIGIPSFFGTSPQNPMVNHLFLLGIVAIVVGIILIAHGAVVKQTDKSPTPYA